MARSLLIGALALIAGSAQAGSGPIAAAVADASRPAADLERDALRKPAETLRFAGVAPKARIGEYMPGGGYFTRVLAKAVGPDGRIYAYVPAEIAKIAPKYLTDAEALAAAPGYANVVVVSGATGAFAGPEPLDIVFTAQNYHDLHGKFAPAGTAKAFNAAVFAALKPGGRYILIDHVAVTGSGLRDVDPMHRIDPAVIRSEVEAAGFVFEAEGAFLRAPGDDHAKSVFDPAIKGRTDQVILRFRKPG